MLNSLLQLQSILGNNSCAMLCLKLAMFKSNARLASLRPPFILFSRETTFRILKGRILGSNLQAFMQFAYCLALGER